MYFSYKIQITSVKLTKYQTKYIKCILNTYFSYLYFNYYTILDAGCDIILQCKGNLVPHESPKGIACCDDVDLCNQHIEPTVVYRSTTFMPGGTLELFAPHFSFSFCRKVKVGVKR